LLTSAGHTAITSPAHRGTWWPCTGNTISTRSCSTS
jgi:hypothetical protein